MNYTETVLLAEADNRAVRTQVLTQRGVNQIIEKVHLDPLDASKIGIRTWICENDERDLTGQCRVFREVVPPAPKEESENPVFQETVLKTPLSFRGDETPNGFRRKHLRKH